MTGTIVLGPLRHGDCTGPLGWPEGRIWRMASQTQQSERRTDNEARMAKTEKTIILMGLEAPEIVDNLDPDKVVWRPKGTDPHFKMLVKRALVEFMARNVQDEWKWDISSADVAVFRNGVDFAHQLRKWKYTRAVITPMETNGN